MSKYIKLDDAIHNINLEVTGRKEYTGDMKANLFFALDELPTIDIVRCKDCEYFKLHESVFGKGWICKRNHIVVGSVDFCSYGERIEK